jgi:hypothetical protein
MVKPVGLRAAGQIVRINGMRDWLATALLRKTSRGGRYQVAAPKRMPAWRDFKPALRWPSTNAKIRAKAEV